MTAKILDGKAIAKNIRSQLKLKINDLIQSGLRAPSLSVVLVDKEPSSEIYVRNKQQACEEIGIISTIHNLPKNTELSTLFSIITDLNQDKSIDGILVQLPLPSTINAHDILEHIHPNKDVDGLHPFNLGKLAQKRPYLRPCTPYGIMTLLKETKINIAGLHATVVGISNIVGKPMIFELLNVGTTVTGCHRLTKDLPAKVKSADILIVATGNPSLIKGNWIKPGAIVIDVGINRLHTGKLVGDVEFDIAKKNASWITPVPGGVGPMTIAALLQNTLYAHQTLIKEQN